MTSATSTSGWRGRRRRLRHVRLRTAATSAGQRARHRLPPTDGLTPFGEPAPGMRFVSAPLTGVWYPAPSPGARPYVNEGDEIASGQVVGLIEAMKLFNEIKSDASGRHPHPGRDRDAGEAEAAVARGGPPMTRAQGAPMTTNALITGWGMYAPSRVMTNDELATLVETTDEWIVSRTGIRERRIAADDETTTIPQRERRARCPGGGRHGCVRARPRDRRHLLARLLHAGHRRARRHQLGATRAAGFDLMAACSGFVFSLATATASCAAACTATCW